MPTREQFNDAWDSVMRNERPAVKTFKFGNDPRLGDCELTCNELWDELQLAYSDYISDNYDDDTGDWISSVLYCLDIEWV
jgi:hypothetical protein